MKILIAEDDPIVREVLQKVLEMEGHLVVEAVDGLDAIHKYLDNQGSIDMVITDYRMPRVNGGTLAHFINSQNLNIPVVVCTGYSSKFTREEAIKEGIVEYLEKPVSLITLRSTINLYTKKEKKPCQN